MNMEWQPIETAPRKHGERIIGWCVFPAGAEWREVKCYTLSTGQTMRHSGFIKA